MSALTDFMADRKRLKSAISAGDLGEFDELHERMERARLFAACQLAGVDPARAEVVSAHFRSPSTTQTLLRRAESDEQVAS